MSILSAKNAYEPHRICSNGRRPGRLLHIRYGTMGMPMAFADQAAWREGEYAQ